MQNLINVIHDKKKLHVFIFNIKMLKYEEEIIQHLMTLLIEKLFTFKISVVSSNLSGNYRVTSLIFFYFTVNLRIFFSLLQERGCMYRKTSIWLFNVLLNFQ